MGFVKIRRECKYRVRDAQTLAYGWEGWYSYADIKGRNRASTLGRDFKPISRSRKVIKRWEQLYWQIVQKKVGNEAISSIHS